MRIQRLTQIGMIALAALSQSEGLCATVGTTGLFEDRLRAALSDTKSSLSLTFDAGQVQIVENQKGPATGRPSLEARQRGTGNGNGGNGANIMPRAMMQEFLLKARASFGRKQGHLGAQLAEIDEASGSLSPDQQLAYLEEFLEVHGPLLTTVYSLNEVETLSPECHRMSSGEAVAFCRVPDARVFGQINLKKLKTLSKPMQMRMILEFYLLARLDWKSPPRPPGDEAASSLLKPGTWAKIVSLAEDLVDAALSANTPALRELDQLEPTPQAAISYLKKNLAKTMTRIASHWITGFPSDGDRGYTHVLDETVVIFTQHGLYIEGDPEAKTAINFSADQKHFVIFNQEQVDSWKLGGIGRIFLYAHETIPGMAMVYPELADQIYKSERNFFISNDLMTSYFGGIYQQLIEDRFLRGTAPFQR